MACKKHYPDDDDRHEWEVEGYGGTEFGGVGWKVCTNCGRHKLFVRGNP